MSDFDRGSAGYERPSWNDDDVPELGSDADPDDIDAASENALADWPSSESFVQDELAEEVEQEPVPEPSGAPFSPVTADAEPDREPEPEPAPGVEPDVEPEPEPEPLHVEQLEHTGEHAPGDLTVPPGYPVLEGDPVGARRAVGIVVSKFNGDVTTKLLESALAELDEAGVQREHVTVMPVPGAFELPVAAMALAKTRRFACIVALGAVIRGDTPHFDYICAEVASGLQVAALETGVPVAFGVLTLDRADQAEHRYDKGAESVRTALEMADLFANLRAAAAR